MIVEDSHSDTDTSTSVSDLSSNAESSSASVSTISNESIMSQDSDKAKIINQNYIHRTLTNNIRISLRFIIMLLCHLAINISVFAIDRGGHMSQELGTLYSHYAENIVSDQVSSLSVRQCVSYLTSHDVVLNWWHSLGTYFEYFHEIQSNVVYLRPPITQCHKCNRNLTLKNTDTHFCHCSWCRNSQ